jgi:anti-sigma factor RsiW
MTMPARPPCANPIDVAVLMDYWRAVLDPPEEEAVETHLFACDACGDRLRQMIALAEGLRDLARSGMLRVVVGDPFVQHLAEAGRTVRAYTASPGDSVQCTVSAGDDHLVARLGADLAGAERVDLSVSMQGVEVQRLADIPVNAETGRVVYQESIGFAKTAPSNSMVMRLLAVDAAGGERVISEYTFHHTRTIPGPPAWEL